MDAKNSGNSSTSVVLGLFAISIQFIRCSVEVIKSVSNSVEESSKASASKTTKNTKTTVQKKNNYGSIENTTAENTNGNIPTTSDDEENQSLLTVLVSKPEKTSSIRTSYTARSLQMMWVVFFALFAFLLVLQLFFPHFFPFVSSQSSSSARTFLGGEMIVIGMATWICAIELFLFTTYYKNCFQRYGPINRMLHISSSLFLWCAITVPIVRVYNNTNNHPISATTTSSNKLHWSDYTYIVATTLYVFCTLFQGRLLLQQTTTTTAACESVASEKQEQKFRVSTLRPLLKPYFWPDATASTAFNNRIRAVSTWVCVIASKVCNLVSPLYLGWASTAIAHGQVYDCIKYSVLYSFISWLGSTLKEGQSLVYLEVAQAAFVQLSETSFGHLHSLSLDWHLRKKLGEVIRSMDRGIAACDTLMKYLFLWLVPALAECVVVCVIFATYFNYLPLGVSVFYFVLIYIVWTIILTIWRKKYRKALTKHDNEWHDLFTDSLVNFETVKFFTAEKYEQNRFKEAVMRYQAGSVDVQASLSFLNISQQVILKLCLAVALGLSAIGIQQRMKCCTDDAGCDTGISECCQSGIGSQTCSGVGMQIGDFVAVLTYTNNLFAPLNFLGSVYNSVVMAVIDITNMAELLAENPDVTDAPDAIVVPKTNKSKKDDVVVEFDNVYFHYPTQPDARGLKGLSFKMKRGTTTAIVGPTGAGKTTVSRLLFRFYDVLGGAVKINGMDIRSVTQESVRKLIGVVPQTASMFNDTIRNNLLYGRQDATEDELFQAVRDAQLLEFIESLDDGWGTIVGDHGLKLSGGERQRAAIARCLLKDPPIVLLDEATSALDTITEKSVQEALDRLGADRTVLVIAHRLGTIRNADNIIVLKDGVAAEQGTHDELLKQKGIYAEMWNMQLHSTSRVDLLES